MLATASADRMQWTTRFGRIIEPIPRKGSVVGTRSHGRNANVPTRDFVVQVPRGALDHSLVYRCREPDPQHRLLRPGLQKLALEFRRVGLQRLGARRPWLPSTKRVSPLDPP